MTPAQRYAFKFRGWFVIFHRVNFLENPYPFGRPPDPPPVRGRRSERPERMFASTYFERASAAAYDRLPNGGRA